MDRYLDPASSLGEIMFGLIMTLTFTLGAGIVIEEEGREGAREMLIGLIGCNIAWGVIDAVMYIVNELFTRGKRRRIGEIVRRSTDVREGERVIAGELDEMLGDVMTAPERASLYTRIAHIVRTTPATANGMTKADFMGAFWSFWLVVISSVPAAIPFLLIDNLSLALRVSNAVLLAILFITGFHWARYTTGKPWVVGFSFLAGGIALVLMAIALGG